ncbi:glycerophosphodiester phosphodiesterase [Allorhizobium sp. BGMRC 0089]|uniref:glycerophosphodiester phosphodiesterase family protein n=1 Tax=Allorhizobium sonneratiae TaxID=2934936 RepID=UPI002033DFAC|nr:glycerophosphodiester phosphodiesterase family protein [Allorhizobium sonneratiae]MCM2291418.1 glycerophosphodiester phosphodiesterase [Allorhizobium sonneratiae]
MSDAISLNHENRRTWLKWHRCHKQAGDISFTPERIIEGMRLGASVEVDILCHAEGGFAVLHDTMLDHATTGHGPVTEASASLLRGLYLRDDAGKASPHRVMLLEDLAALLLAEGCAETALLQLDLKEENDALTQEVVLRFSATIAPVARHMILSGGDAQAVARLAAATPGLGVGYDPCHHGAMEEVLASQDFAGFVDKAVKAIAATRMIYLDHHLVEAAYRRHGVNLIRDFQAHGMTVDVYTIKTTSPETLSLVQLLMALGADQITTDDPVGLQAQFSGLTQV